MIFLASQPAGSPTLGVIDFYLYSSCVPAGTREGVIKIVVTVPGVQTIIEHSLVLELQEENEARDSP